MQAFRESQLPKIHRIPLFKKAARYAPCERLRVTSWHIPMDSCRCWPGRPGTALVSYHTVRTNRARRTLPDSTIVRTKNIPVFLKNNFLVLDMEFGSFVYEWYAGTVPSTRPKQAYFSKLCK